MTRHASSFLATALIVGAACGSPPTPLEDRALRDFATRYTAAWNSQNAGRVASFFTDSGSLTINEAPPAVGRAEIAEAAQGFMTAFPDLTVRMDSVTREGQQAVYHWTLTGTNTGPGGIGNAVRISGYEEWRLGPDGRIVESKGHFDEADFRRQLNAGALPE